MKFKNVYDKISTRRNFRTASLFYGEISYGEISLRRNILTMKFPYCETSLRRNFFRRDFPLRNFIRRNFLASFQGFKVSFDSEALIIKDGDPLIIIKFYRWSNLFMPTFWHLWCQGHYQPGWKLYGVASLNFSKT